MEYTEIYQENTLVKKIGCIVDINTAIKVARISGFKGRLQIKQMFILGKTSQISVYFIDDNDKKTGQIYPFCVPFDVFCAIKDDNN